MVLLSQTSSEPLERRLPERCDGVDVNFCRNPSCASYGVLPDPFKRPRRAPPAPSGAVRGVVSGSKDEEYFQCPTCGKTNRLKNNRAIAEEYRRLRDLQASDPVSPACRTAGCFAETLTVTANPDFYRKFGTTAKGDPRYQCKLCKGTFSAGKPARRHRRSDKNKLIFNMLVNGLPLSKICAIAEVSYHDLYRKIDFIHAQAAGFVARREDFSRVDFCEAGSRFATDSQTLTINWPTRRERTPIRVQYLCTAHARSGYIMEAAIQFDPSMTMNTAERQALSGNDPDESLAFRRHARVWTKSEFEAHLKKMQKQKRIDETELYQLPHDGVLVRYDILQLAHVLRLREMLSGTDAHLCFVFDDDRGLRGAFTSMLSDGVRAGRVDLAIVSFDKGMTNDHRNRVVAEGQAELAEKSGKSLPDIRALSDEDYAALVDDVVADEIVGVEVDHGYLYPFPRKSEPNRKIWLLTADLWRPREKVARLLRLATLRSVDSYFHKFRSNIRFAARPGQTPSSDGQSWDRYYLYKPATMLKLAEIYRFHHNWCCLGQDKKTPAMRLGLARGRVYERDFL